MEITHVNKDEVQMNHEGDIITLLLIFFWQAAQSDFHGFNGARSVTIPFKSDFLCW